MVGDAAILVTKVISESVRDGRNWLYFDDGTYGSFMEVLLYRMAFPLRALTANPATPQVLAGPTCDCIDVFSRDAQGEIAAVDLPEMHLDDLLERREQFRNKLIIAAHLSTRYHPKQVRHFVDQALPDMLDGRLHLWL